MNNRTKAKQTKYRPVLTASQIVHILHLAKSEAPLSSASMSVISTLSPFLAKIENAAITPAYSTTPREDTTSLEALGGEPELIGIDTCSKEDYWHQCYNKYSLNPSSCSLKEIEAAKEHMYLHDLMTPEEQEEFEKGM